MSLYEISPTDISGLGETALVDTMNHLLWAEADLIGVPPPDVHTSLRIDDPDGGIDGRVENTPSGSRWLPHGESVWQFKAGKVGPADIRKEFKKPGVQTSIQKGGAYFFANGDDLNDPRMTRAEQTIEKCFIDQGLAPRGTVLAASQIARWASEHPAIAFLPYFGRPVHGDVMRWRTWADQPRFQRDFAVDPLRSDLIDRARSYLRGTLDLRYFRIEGLAGVGKTHLALEACGDAGIRERVLYADSPQALPNGLFQWLEEKSKATLILVVDECDQVSTERLAARSARCEGRVKLVTIGLATEPLIVLHRPPEVHLLGQLDDATMAELLRHSYAHLPNEVVSFVTRLASGYVKFAVAIADEITRRPELASAADLAKTQDVLAAIEKFVVPDPLDRRAMYAVALLSRLGWDGDLSSEGRPVVAFVGLGWEDARFRVSRLVDAGLIAKQGRYRYVTPHIVAVYLAANVWRARGEDALRLLADLPNTAATLALLERLRDLGDEPEAARVCSALLAPDGMFPDIAAVSDELRSEVFAILAEAQPQAGLKALERILRHLPRDALLQFREGRRHIVWLLEKLAWLPETFFGAARLLLALAEAENETYANNATGTWTGLFGVNLGGTAVPILDRYPLIAEALASPSVERHLLAVDAIGRALSIDEIRMAQGERHGGRVVPPEWHAKDHEEDLAARRSALGLLDRSLGASEPRVAEAARDVLLSSARSLVLLGLADEILTRVGAIPLGNGEIRRKVRGTVEDILEFEQASLRPEQRNAFENLLRSLVGESFHDRLHRWVGRWTSADWRDTREEGARSAGDEAAALADEAAQSPDLLEAELDWLASPEAENVGDFAERLGLLDTDARWWPGIEEGVRPGEGSLLASAYLRGRVSAGRKDWRDSVLVRWALESKMAAALLDAVWRSEPDDQDAERLIGVTQKSWLPADRLALLVYGGRTQYFLSQAFFRLVDQVLTAGGAETAPAALSLIEQRLDFRPEDLATLQPLAFDAMERYSVSRATAHSIYDWARVAERYSVVDPVRLVRAFLGLIAQDEALLIRENPLTPALEKASRSDPQGAWSEVGSTLLKKDRASLRLYFYLRGWYAALFEPDYLLAWAKANLPEGPRLIAWLTPMHGETLSPLARELLIRFAGNNAVASELSANFNSGTWMGPFSGWIESHLKLVREWAKDPHPAVREWVEKEAEILERRLDQAKREEEEERP